MENPIKIRLEAGLLRESGGFGWEEMGVGSFIKAGRPRIQTFQERDESGPSVMIQPRW